MYFDVRIGYSANSYRYSDYCWAEERLKSRYEKVIFYRVVVYKLAAL
jgi:hypothetical protein